jgi:hypothetical protein
MDTHKILSMAAERAEMRDIVETSFGDVMLQNQKAMRSEISELTASTEKVFAQLFGERPFRQNPASYAKGEL